MCLLVSINHKDDEIAFFLYLPICRHTVIFTNELAVLPSLQMDHTFLPSIAAGPLTFAILHHDIGIALGLHPSTIVEHRLAAPPAAASTRADLLPRPAEGDEWIGAEVRPSQEEPDYRGDVIEAAGKGPRVQPKEAEDGGEVATEVELELMN